MARYRGNFTTYQNTLPDLISLLPEEVEQRLQVAATLIESEVKEILTGQRHGRRYKVPATNRYWTASDETEAPAVRLGELRRKYVGFVEGSGYYAEGIVASPTLYSKWLEFGTRRMAPRPHLSIAAANVEPQLPAIFANLFGE
jgi:hypothetical protein